MEIRNWCHGRAARFGNKAKYLRLNFMTLGLDITSTTTNIPINVNLNTLCSDWAPAPDYIELPALILCKLYRLVDLGQNLKERSLKTNLELKINLITYIYGINKNCARFVWSEADAKDFHLCL